MAQLSNCKTKLFIQGGPGKHSYVEQEIFGNRFPNVDFWTQPKSLTFLQATKEVEHKINELVARNNNKPIELIAHSFGGQYVRNALESNAQNISKISLVNCAFNPFECFINLGQKLLGSLNAPDPASLRLASIDEKMKYIFSLAVHPGFSESYWCSTDKYNAYTKISEKYSQLDVQVFSSIFSDYLLQKEQTDLPTFQWLGEIVIFASTNDLLIEFEKDIKPWTEIFPMAKFVEIKKSGHLSFFENEDLAIQLFA